MLIPGSRQWAAEQGCYVVAAFNDDDNPPHPMEYRQPVLYPSSADEAEGLNNFRLHVAKPFSTVGGSTAQTAYWRPTRWAPINSSGAIFTGLSAQTTLTLQVNMYYEAFPNIAEKEWLVLATPSACYDPLALQMVTHALESLPVGVPAHDNGLGDWFAGVVRDVAGDAMVQTALAAFHPGAALAANVASRAADAYLTANAANQKPRMKKKQAKVSRDIVVIPPKKQSNRKQPQRK
jgi:hypothetical protein